MSFILVQLEFGEVGFCRERKSEEPSEEPSKQGKDLQQTTLIYHRAGIKPGGRRAFSPLRHPLSPYGDSDQCSNATTRRTRLLYEKNSHNCIQVEHPNHESVLLTVLVCPCYDWLTIYTNASVIYSRHSEPIVCEPLQSSYIIWKFLSVDYSLPRIFVSQCYVQIFCFEVSNSVFHDAAIWESWGNR